MSKPAKLQFYNFTGTVVDVQTSEIPLGTFVVDKVNTLTSMDWLDTLWAVINAFSSIVSGIASVIVQVVFLASGITLPEWLITVVVVVLAFYFIVKHWKGIGLIITIILGFLMLSSGLNLFRIFFGPS
jgi:hypothetical protein